MSCSTLSQAFVSLNVSMGALPEGFCPATMQDLANSIATRLIVTPNQAFSTFAIGSVEPASNVGPWLKNCEEWFIFDDATGRYIPIARGFLFVQKYDASDTFIVPDNIYRIKVDMWGGGAGGGGRVAAQGGGGGGGGGYGSAILTVVPAQAISVNIGAGGAGGPDGAAGGDGGDTTFLTLTAGGGKAGGPGGGGGGRGGLGGVQSAGFDYTINGQRGRDCDALVGAVTLGGEGGDSPCGGGGGAASQDVGHNLGILPGGGGAGGFNGTILVGGAGAGGRILIHY